MHEHHHIGEVVPAPEDAQDYTHLRETAPEILQASKKHPPVSDECELEAKPEDETGPAEQAGSS